MRERHVDRLLPTSALARGGIEPAAQGRALDGELDPGLSGVCVQPSSHAGQGSKLL